MQRTISLIAVLTCITVFAQPTKVVFSDRERPIAEQIKTLRAVPDAKRGAITKQLALDVRVLPVSPNKLLLASSLANLSTEGDFGRPALQEVATTLSQTLHEQATASTAGMPEAPYITLAQLVRYEGVTAPLNDPLMNAAMARLQADDQRRQNADFTLLDITGRSRNLHEQRGKVVLVNFWATWCAPCCKEMPDLEAIYQQFRDKGLVILAISDEDSAKVNPFIAEHKYTYPILLDPGDKVTKMMAVDGIPKSFVYDREGRLAAQAIDMRTHRQLLEMLSRAGLR